MSLPTPRLSLSEAGSGGWRRSICSIPGFTPAGLNRPPDGSTAWRNGYAPGKGSAKPGFIYGAGEDARRCLACGEGRLELKASRYGLFVGCASWPACGFRRTLAAGDDAGEGHAGPKALGSEPGTGLAVSLRRGRRGIPFLSLRPAAAPRR